MKNILLIALLCLLEMTKAFRNRLQYGKLKKLKFVINMIESDGDKNSEVVMGEIASSDLWETKQDLLSLAAGCSRGEFATSADKEKILNLIEQLELSNRTPSPSLNSLGVWKLVYSSTYLFRSSPFFMAARAVCKDEKEADQFNYFCELHRESLSFTQIGVVNQIIDNDTLTSEFESKASLIPGLPFYVTGIISSTAEIVEKTKDSITLYLNTVKIKEGSSNIPMFDELFSRTLPSRELSSFLESQFITYSSPKPVFRTYYLDNNMRISRDQDDNVFVYTRQ